MDSPFYRSHWNYPSRRGYYYSPSPASSVRDVPPKADIQQTTMPARKVVSIPVHYVGSEKRRSESAVMIQKVFRGFLVRKSVKKIAAIRKEVDEIEKRILTEETVELIRKDSRERLKVNEMLMSLLFKLDSVRGVDSGVRDCRKAVIKKAIALQEMVDSIVAVTVNHPNAEPVDSSVDTAVEVRESKQIFQTEESELPPPDFTGNHCENDVGVRSQIESVPVAVTESHDMERERQGNPEPSEVDGDADADRKGEEKNDDEVTTSVSGYEESMGPSQTESQADSSPIPLQNSVKEEREDATIEKHDVDMGIHESEQNEEAGKEKPCGGGSQEENERNRELLERMMEDNERMMGLMAELCARNEMQTQLLGSLSLRVERLEKAFLCEKLRRKKKRNAAGGLVDCLESTEDSKKSGKR